MKILSALFLPCLLFASIATADNDENIGRQIIGAHNNNDNNNNHNAAINAIITAINNSNHDTRNLGNIYNHHSSNASPDQNPPHADSLLLNPWLGAQAGKILNAWDTMPVETKFKVTYGFSLAVFMPLSLYNHDVYSAAAIIFVLPIMFLLAKEYLPVSKDGTFYKLP